WLILKQKNKAAQGILERIYGSKEEAHMQLMQTVGVVSSEQKSEWRMLLKPGIRKAVFVGMAIAILGQFMGVNAVLYYGPTIFEESGLSSGDSLLFQVLVGTVNMVTAILALLIIDKMGRKKLVYYGVSGMILTLVLIGAYFMVGKAMGITAIALLLFVLAYVFFCAVSICAVIWVLLSEMYPIKVRGVAMSIAGLSLWIGTYLIGQLTPWLLQNILPANTFFLFAVMCLPYMYIVWKLVPDTTGKSLEEIEGMWEISPEAKSEPTVIETEKI
ncbi:MAG: MFS transporter, partial [Bacteroidales bacterium]